MQVDDNGGERSRSLTAIRFLLAPKDASVGTVSTVLTRTAGTSVRPSRMILFCEVRLRFFKFELDRKLTEEQAV